MEVFAVVFYLILLVCMGLMALATHKLYRQTCDDKQYIEQLERSIDTIRDGSNDFWSRGNDYKEKLRVMTAERDSLKELVDHYRQLSDAHQGRHRELHGRLDHIIKIASGELTLEES